MTTKKCITMGDKTKTYKGLFVAVLVCVFLLSRHVSAQSDFPAFLKGTWKTEDKDVFEHWDLLNDSTMMGVSYRLENGLVHITEYLNMSRRGSDIVYTATVPSQNEGRSIIFKMTNTDDTYIFENPLHDFPQRITYQLKAENEITVKVSGNAFSFSANMNKIQRAVE